MRKEMISELEQLFSNKCNDKSKFPVKPDSTFGRGLRRKKRGISKYIPYNCSKA